MAPPTNAIGRLARCLIENASARKTCIVATPSLRIELRDGFLVGLYRPHDGEPVEGPWVATLAETLRGLEFAGESDPFEIDLERVVHDGGHTTRVDAVSVLLEALTDIASPTEAAALASSETDAVEFREGPRLRSAIEWSRLPAAGSTVSLASLTSRSVELARRVIALRYAGFVSIVPRSTRAEGPVTHPSIDDGTNSPQSPLRPGYARLALPKDLVRDEGADGVILELDDPLLEHFERIALLERTHTPDAEVAAQWREAARLWRTRYGAVREAAHCLREAAAKAPTDSSLLLDASYACAGIGDLDAAIAYAKSAASLASGGRPREKAATQLAHLCLRAGEHRMAIAALRGATRDEPVRAETFARLSILVGATDHEEAQELVAEARRRDPVAGDPGRYDAEAAASMLRFAIDSGDPDRIEAIGNSALIEALTTPSLDGALYASVDALDALDGADRALGFAVRLADRLGTRNDSFRERLIRLAERATHAPLRAAAYERALGCAPPEVAEAILTKIAALHRNIGDRAAESRAWLRILDAAGPADESAFTSLLRIYVECGQTSPLRALAAIAEADAEAHPSASAHLRLLRATSAFESPTETFDRALVGTTSLSPRERRVVVEHAAALIERSLDDPAEQASLLGRAVQAAPSSPAVLVAFERACLLAKDARVAERVFDALTASAVGPNTRRAVLYRAARLYENLGTFRLALEAYAASFREVPSAGVTLSALERLGHLIGDVRPAVDALRTLARSRNAPGLQSEWSRRADELEAPLSQPPPSVSGHPAVFSEESLEAAVASRDPDCALSLARSLLGHPTRWPEAGVLLRAAIRWAPHRRDILRALATFATRQSSRFEARVCTSLLACFDGTQSSEPIAAPSLYDALLMSAIDDELPRGAREALSLLWLHASPLFRRTLADYGAKPGDRLPPLAQTPTSRAWRRAAHLLGDTETLLYKHSRGGDGTLTLARTAPPSIVVPERVDSPELELKFRIARLLVLARAPYVLITTATGDEGRDLLDAMFAAFGPSSGEERPSKQALGLAGELWNTMPPREQRALRDALGECGPIDHAGYVRAALATAARVGLLIVGDPGTALRGLAADDPNATAVSRKGDDLDWEAFVALSPSAQALIRFALSEPYLTALALSPN